MAPEPISARTARRSDWPGGDAFHLLDRPGLSVAEQVLETGASGESHRHRRARQFFYVVQGTATLVVGRKELTLPPGSGAEVPPGVRHQISNTGPDVVRVLVVSSPGVSDPRRAGRSRAVPRRGVARDGGPLVVGSHLRRTRSGDLERVVALEEAQETRRFLGQGGQDWHQRALVDPDMEHWVLVDRLDRVLAFGVLAGLSRPDTVEIRRMVVAPEGRGQGLGRMLLRRLLEHALASPRVQRVWLEVSRDNTPARSLYRAFGFVERPAPADAVVLPDGVYMEWTATAPTLGG